jgi:2-methylaconitate cis-trans-isomerase PrpF
MGLIASLDEAARRQHTPKIAFVAPRRLPRLQRQDGGRDSGPAGARPVDGQAASRHDGHRRGGHRHGGAIPGTLVNRAAGGGERRSVRFGHPSGTLRVGAEARYVDGAGRSPGLMSRSARSLMEGWIRVPGDCI